MIHDKDYMIRMVREFSNFLSKLLLGKNEGSTEEESEMAFDTQMRDIFRLTFEDLSSKTKEELVSLVETHEAHHQADYYELLGNIFYYKIQSHPSKDAAEKAKLFYELWLQKSSIFSLPVMSRLQELNTIINS